MALLSSTPTNTYELKVSHEGTLPTFVQDTRVIKRLVARGYHQGVAKIKTISILGMMIIPQERGKEP